MIEFLLAKLDEWKTQSKKNDAWDEGDCEALSKIRYAVNNFYGPIERVVTHSKGQG